MNDIVKIWLKEYKKMFTDGGIIMLFVVAIVIYPILYSLTYANETPKNVPIAVVDLNQSNMSRQVARMLDATDEVEVKTKIGDFSKAQKLYKTGDINGIILIPENFDKQIYKQESTSVTVYADAAYMLLYKQILSAATYSVGTLNAGIEVQKRMANGESMNEALYAMDPLPIKSFGLYNPNGGYASYAMPAFLIIVLQQTLLIGIGLLGGTNRENGMSHYLVPMGIKRWGSLKIVLAKSFAYFTLYLLNSYFVLVIISRAFNIPMRYNIFELFVFITPFLFAVIYLGMTIASFFKHRESSMLVLLFTSIPFLFLSGFSWPGHMIPEWQIYLSEIIPTTPAIKGYLALALRGVGFYDVAHHWIHLWCLSFVFIITASLNMKYQIKKSYKKLPVLYDNRK
jgi:ABC-2 type transport system permease protein